MNAFAHELNLSNTNVFSHECLCSMFNFYHELLFLWLYVVMRG